VRTQDNIKRFQTVPVPGHTLNETELAEAVRQLELEIADTGRRLHEAGGQGIERLPGVTELLDALRKGGARWGICTSGTSSSISRSRSFSPSSHLLARRQTLTKHSLARSNPTVRRCGAQDVRDRLDAAQPAVPHHGRRLRARQASPGALPARHGRCVLLLYVFSFSLFRR